VILPPAAGAVAGVDVRGFAPGTRETVLLDPVCMVDRVHAILLSGGSAFGLAAADGVMRWLEERGRGFDTGVARVPIVPAAILFDLGIGRTDVRPDAAAGYAACANASSDPVVQGSIGAGTGATVGKLAGLKGAMKGGIGSASRRVSRSDSRSDSRSLGSDIVVAALVAVNAVGDIIDTQGRIIAGARRPDGTFADAMTLITERLETSFADMTANNTTLAVVATNAQLSKAGATQVARMAHDGLARAIRPIHTSFDGDAVFALSTGEVPAQPGLIGAVAADVLAEAVINAVRTARGLHGVPGIGEDGH
jgi:L-aminopeptidase/D-esterase-like protein